MDPQLGLPSAPVPLESSLYFIPFLKATTCIYGAFSIDGGRIALLAHFYFSFYVPMLYLAAPCLVKTLYN